MGVPRRRFLGILSSVAGSGFLLAQTEFALAKQSSTAPLNPAAPSAKSAPPQPAATELQKVSGIGGLFFRAHDPEGLARWYQQNLGIALIPTSYDQQVWRQEAGPTAFSPFPETTKYFGDPNKAWMVNFRVHDLDKMASQLRAAGIEVKMDPQSYPNGRFARIHDPEGNPIELWEPKEPGASHL
jgi:predicted enzyme related to lactoylglutathione lyase